MRKVFLIIFLFTLCSSRRIHRRSEDVDPLLKELFSEINDPVPKDRRDGQTSGDQDAGTTASPADDLPTDEPAKSSTDKSDDSLMNTEHDADKQTTAAPENKAKTAPDAQANDMDKNTKETNKDDASMTTPSSKTDDEGSDDMSSMSASDKTKSETSGKESADATQNEASMSSGEQTPAIAPSKSESSDEQSKATKDEPATSEAKTPAVASSEKASANPEPSGKETAEGGQNEPAANDAGKPEVASSEQASANPEPSSKDKAEKTNSEPAVDDKENAALAAPEKESPASSDKQSADAMDSEPAVSDEQKSAVATSGHASSNDNMENEGQAEATASSKDQPADASANDESASATSADAPAEKQETPAAAISAANQEPSSPVILENSAGGNIPESPASSVVTSNNKLMTPSSNAVDMRSNIPAAPSTLSQAAWSAASPLSVAPSPETNEKQGSIRKDSIPAAPVQPGASSYPLQLNKHSPGAELIKRFFIAKQEAKKRKEEDAKMKSLIGDGKYTVSSNNGYYNYAASPQVPSASPTGANTPEDACVDKYESCPEFAKNHYCTDYKTLMKVQCRKSCKFCDGDEEDDDDDDDDLPKTTANPINNDDDDDDDDDEKKSDDKEKQKDGDDEKSDDKEGKESDDDDDDKESDKDSTKHDDDDDDDDDDGDKTSDKKANSTKQTDDDDDDDELDRVISGKDKASSEKKPSEKDEKFQDVDAGSSDSGKGSGKGEDLPPTAEEFEDEEEDDEKKGKGSGSNSDDSKEDDDSDELAKDLAEQELFSEQKSKKNAIPRPQPAVPAAYPKIDLKDIARYVSLYRNVAKKLFGEALDSAKKEFVAQQSKRSDIPVPIKERLRSEKNTGDSLEGFYSSQSNKRDKIAMNPNNAQYSQTDEQWANKAYKEAESYLRSKIPEFKNYAPPAMFNYPFYINDPNKTAEQEETNEGTTSRKSEIPESPEQKYNKTLTEILRRDHLPKKASDPYEYLRNMIPGSSMKPIATKNGIAYIRDTYSRPLQLNTKSQWLDMVAKKRNSIPRAQRARARSNVVRPAVVPQMQTGPEALAAQVAQYKSTISSTTQSPSAEQGRVRAEVPQVQLQQFPGDNANFLQSNQAAEPLASFQQLHSRSKVARVKRHQAHHKN